MFEDLTHKDPETKRRVPTYMETLYTNNRKPRFINGRLYSEDRPDPLTTINASLAQSD